MSSPRNSAGFPVSQRDPFLIPSGPNLAIDEYHLFIVLTDPAKHDQVLLVNASTVHPGVPHDTTCYLQVGDHPFIKTTSYIVFAKARILSIKRLQSLIAAKTIIYRPPPVTAAVLTKIVAGIGSSRVDPIHTAFYHNYK